jgi:hypothetical protein
MRVVKTLHGVVINRGRQGLLDPPALIRRWKHCYELQGLQSKRLFRLYYRGISRTNSKMLRALTRQALSEALSV